VPISIPRFLTGEMMINVGTVFAMDDTKKIQFPIFIRALKFWGSFSPSRLFESTRNSFLYSLLYPSLLDILSLGFILNYLTPIFLAIHDCPQDVIFGILKVLFVKCPELKIDFAVISY
jgi:hypothetical protein